MQVLLQSLAWSILQSAAVPLLLLINTWHTLSHGGNKSVQVAVVPEKSHVPQDTGWSVATHTCVTQPGQLP